MSDKQQPKEKAGDPIEISGSTEPSTAENSEKNSTEPGIDVQEPAETIPTDTSESIEETEAGEEPAAETVPETAETPAEITPEATTQVVDAPEDSTAAEAAEPLPVTNKEKQETSEEKSDSDNRPEAEASTVSEAEVTASDESTDETVEKVAVKKEEKEEKEKEEEDNEDDDDDEAHEEEEEEKDYHALSKEALIIELQSLLKKESIQQIKSKVEEIKTEFNAKFDEEVEHQKEEFLASGGNIIDFHYTTPLKKQFNSLYFDYKEKRNKYYQNLKRDLQENYKKREELIEELKGLLNAEENINTTYKHFKDIQERWHTAGAIPRDKYNTIWNTYRHHVENFYDFLHLNREFRDLDFKHNLEQKLKFIGRAEELAQQTDINRAFRELQMLHKMWKEDVGPVAKEFREEVWEKFSAATKVIHDKRQEYLKDQEQYFEVNFEQKMALIEKLIEVASKTENNHKSWQNAIKEVQKLRDAYFEIGKVPRTKAKEIWNAFKEATRNFNKDKNAFYKNQKKEQYLNLEKKRELIKIAEENKDNDDFAVVTPLMKKIQHDWKAIGHVPRKESDKIWKQFKEACNHYFNKVHAERNEANKEEQAHLEAKQALLENMAAMELSGDSEADLVVVKQKIKDWKAIGRVPYNKKNIERKFNKVLDELFGKLKLDKQQTEMIRFENKLSSMASEEDNRKLQNEEFFITKRITETQGEIRQLENNLGFFRHAKQDNPLVVEVHKNIARHKEQLDVWKSKLTKIRSLRKQQ